MTTIDEWYESRKQDQDFESQLGKLKKSQAQRKRVILEDVAKTIQKDSEKER